MGTRQWQDGKAERSSDATTEESRGDGSRDNDSNRDRNSMGGGEQRRLKAITPHATRTFHFRVHRPQIFKGLEIVITKEGKNSVRFRSLRLTSESID